MALRLIAPMHLHCSSHKPRDSGLEGTARGDNLSTVYKAPPCSQRFSGNCPENELEPASEKYVWSKYGFILNKVMVYRKFSSFFSFFSSFVVIS